MPTLPLPPLGPGFGIDAGDLPVSSITDVLAEWSPDITKILSAPVWQAIQQGQLAGLLTYQTLSRYAAAQSDPLRATGEYLDECGWERQVYRAAGELDPAYSARVNAQPSTVDPNDIIAAANAVLSPFTSVSCRYAEHLDGWFASNPSTTTWSCHAFNDGQLHTASWTTQDPNFGGGPFAVPNYPDRLYSQIQNRRPQGLIVFNAAPTGGSGRLFVLRTPDVSFVDNNVTAAYQPSIGSPTVLATTVGGGGSVLIVQNALGMGSAPFNISVGAELMTVTTIINPTQFAVLRGINGTSAVTHNAGAVVYPAPFPQDPATGLADGSYGMFVGNPADGTSSPAVAFVWAYSQTSTGIYQSVVNSVEAIRGQSMRWTLLSDPNLI